MKWGPGTQCCHQVLTRIEYETQHLRTRTTTRDTKSTKHTMALSIPASEPHSARNALVRARSIKALCIRTGSWNQAFIDVFEREDKRKYWSKS